MIAIPVLEYVRKAFKPSNMTSKEKGLYSVLVLILFTEWQPEKYHNGTLMQSLGECFAVLFLKTFYLVSCFKQKAVRTNHEWLGKKNVSECGEKNYTYELFRHFLLG